MLAEFKNQFSWSKSRHDLFKDCERKYYFNYYGSWNGWKYDAPERTRRTYYLKKLQSRYMWIGTAVHNTIEKLLKNYRLGILGADKSQLQAGLLALLRQEFVDSRSGNWKKKKWRLIEHEYEMDVSDDEWKAIADQAVLCLGHFLDSKIHQVTRELGTSEWLEIEDFSHFYENDVKVHVVLDFSYRKGDEVFIYDWKTGKESGEIHALQLACYRIYAQQAWKADPDKITTVEYNLFRDEVKEYKEETLSMDEAKRIMKASMDEMLGKLDDPKENVASEENFKFTDDEFKCNYCNFKEVCPKFSE